MAAALLSLLFESTITFVCFVMSSIIVHIRKKPKPKIPVQVEALTAAQFGNAYSERETEIGVESVWKENLDNKFSGPAQKVVGCTKCDNECLF